MERSGRTRGRSLIVIRVRALLASLQCVQFYGGRRKWPSASDSSSFNGPTDLPFEMNRQLRPRCDNKGRTCLGMDVRPSSRLLNSHFTLALGNFRGFMTNLVVEQRAASWEIVKAKRIEEEGGERKGWPRKTLVQLALEIESSLHSMTTDYSVLIFKCTTVIRTQVDPWYQVPILIVTLFL